MKYLSIVLSMLLINTSASGAMSPRFYETEILGNWICKDIWPGYSAFEMIRYKEDGTWNSFGELIVDFPIDPVEPSIAIFFFINWQFLLLHF